MTNVPAIKKKDCHKDGFSIGSAIILTLLCVVRVSTTDFAQGIINYNVESRTGGRVYYQMCDVRGYHIKDK